MRALTWFLHFSTFTSCTAKHRGPAFGAELQDGILKVWGGDEDEVIIKTFDYKL